MKKGRPSKNFLSVVMPAYRQEKTIEKDLRNVLESLRDGLGKNYKYEVICVVDGLVDATYKRASKVKSKKLRVYSYKENKGKGFAVRFGMSKAKGDLISFLDTGMEISPKGIMMLLAHMDWYNADVIVGSKKHPVSKVNYPFFRKVFSFGYHLGVRILFGLSLKDTQSGIKVFKRKVVDKMLKRLLVKKYAMDIEMLVVAKHLGFDRIYEAPIEVRFSKGTSRINWKTIYSMIWDTCAVFYRLKLLGYYNDSNKKNWIKD